jgi:hypothetical protein
MTHRENFQDGISCKKAPVDKRMYADGSECFLVKMLKLLIYKTPCAATSLFNQYDKSALGHPNKYGSHLNLFQRELTRIFPRKFVTSTFVFLLKE